MKKSLMTLAASSLMLIGNSAFAVQPYITGQIGQSDVDAGRGVFADSVDDTATYFGIGVGFKVTENFALEIGYHDFGKAEAGYHEDFTNAFEAGKESLELDSVSVAAVGNLPLGPSVSVYGKVGLDVWNAQWKDSYHGSDNQGSFYGGDKIKDDGTSLFFGVGAAFNVTADTSMFIEYQVHQFNLQGHAYEDADGYYDVDYDIDADVLSVGATFSF